MRTNEQRDHEAMWRRVSIRRPCPICAGVDGCSVHEEDSFASCSREPSDWPLTNGGWLHRVIHPAPLGPALFPPSPQLNDHLATTP